MGRLFKWLIVLGVLVGGGYAAYKPAMQWWAARNKVTFRTEESSRGKITAYVNSTGEVKPVQSVKVGAFVSGPIIELNVDFNDRVEKDELLALIDPRLPAAAVERERATLATRNADIERVEAQLQQARNDERRAEELRAENNDFISQAEMDRLHFARVSLEAQLKVAEAQVLQAKASLENAEANLAYTEIRAPVGGIIIDRKVDSGQTVASGFQTPELFTIAPRLDELVNVFASVDEADIGLIRRAQEEGREVEFTVDAYPQDTFTGTIDQIRFSSTTTQNVVTYPVVVEAENPDLKLLPGMTADLSFLVEEREDVLRVPNAALRFLPDARHVRNEDKAILRGGDSKNDKKPESAAKEDSAEGSEAAESSIDEEEATVTDGDETDTPDDSAADPDDGESKSDKSDGEADSESEKDRVRHVWIKEGEKLRAIAIRTGLSSSRYTEVREVVSGELSDDQELVVGVQ